MKNLKLKAILCAIPFAILLNSCNDDESGEPIAEAQCVELSGDFPRFIELPPVGDNGSYDPTLAGDPETGRVWMVFSRVDGPGGEAKVSTHLAYSDDHGDSWCYVNQINASEEVALDDLPAEFEGKAISAHWSHEVPSIAYHPGAGENEPWQMTWHRYLHVDDGNSQTDDREFAYGWIAMKKAASPELLANSPEIKLFSALGYYKDAATESYNNAIGGEPQIKLHELHPDLDSAAVFTETGMHEHNNELFISLVMGDFVKGNSVILIKQNSSGNWEYLSTLLGKEEAELIDPKFSHFSATDLFKVGEQAYILVSPVDELYAGTVLYELDFDQGIIVPSSPAVWIQEKPANSNIFQSGVATYDELSYKSGVLYGDALPEVPQFRIYASGIVPE